MLVTLNEVTKTAFKDKYAVPAFNTWSFNDAKAIVKGAEEMNSPVILMTSGSAIKNWTVEVAAAIITTMAKQSPIPIVLHLDHATDFSVIEKAIESGYTSIMYDGSILPLSENISNTNEILKKAKKLNVSVEAEIGQIGRGEEGEIQDEILTEPHIAQNFLEQAPVDALAVAIGTCHGMQKQEANVRTELAKKISDVVSVPLVLHGSSGVKNEDLQYIARIGFGKINFGTKLKTSYVKEMRRVLSSDDSISDHIKLFTLASKVVTEIVKDKITHVGSKGKA